MRLVICGFGSAGYSALMTIKRFNPKADVTIIDPKIKELMHPCGLPYALEGVVKMENLTQDIDLSRMGVSRIKGRGEKISHQEKTVTVKTETGTETVEYDKLLIATGYRALTPPITGLDKHLNKSVYTLADVNDLARITEKLKTSKKGAVIGAGAIGLETAFALKEYLEKVTVIEMQNQTLYGTLDRDMSSVVEEYLKDNSIEFIKEAAAEKFNGESGLTSVSCGNSHVEADIGILATGFAANLAIIENSGIKTGDSGIAVNSFLETSVENIYAAGDCISGWWVIDKSPSKAKLATSAYKQGSAAAMNMIGRKTEYQGSAGTFVTKIGNLEIAGTGFTTDAAKERGYKPVAGKITSHIMPEYFPDNSQITIKIIFDSESGKILGAQAIGEKGAAERINIVSTAIEFNISIEQLGRTELAYCPAVSEVYDPLLRAIDFGLRRMKK